MYYVDVQHPETGEWTRRFTTEEEADRYVEHMQKVRGCIAQKRRLPGMILTPVKQRNPLRFVSDEDLVEEVKRRRLRT